MKEDEGRRADRGEGREERRRPPSNFVSTFPPKRLGGGADSFSAYAKMRTGGARPVLR